MIVRLKPDVGSSIQDAISGLKPDKYYRVHAVSIPSDVQFYIYEESDFSVPIQYNGGLFDLIDPRLSRHWVFSDHIKATDNSMSRPAMLAIPEWCSNSHFYQDLVEEEGTAAKIWCEYRDKNRFELEFSDPSIVQKAAAIKEHWVQCCECQNIWQDAGFDELIICPECASIQERPGILLVFGDSGDTEFWGIPGTQYLTLRPELTWPSRNAAAHPTSPPPHFC